MATLMSSWSQHRGVSCTTRVGLWPNFPAHVFARTCSRCGACAVLCEKRLCTHRQCYHTVGL